MRAVLILAVVTLLFAGAQTTHGQGRAWDTIAYPSLGEGVAACEGGDVGHRLCFGLRCIADSPTPEWFTFQAGGDSAQDDIDVAVIIDGKRHHNLPMTEKKRDAGGEWEFSAQYNNFRDAGFVRELKAGSQIYVLIGGVSGMGLSLRGSARALDAAFAQCGRKSASVQVAKTRPSVNDALLLKPDATGLDLSRANMPAPLLAAVEEIDEACGSDRVEPDEEGFIAEDIDGDGIYDFLLDQVTFCPARLLTICGASHCPFTVVVSAEGAWKRFDYILQGYRTFSPDGFLVSCPDGGDAGIRRNADKLLRNYCGQKPEVMATYTGQKPTQPDYPQSMAARMAEISATCSAGGKAVGFDEAISRFDFNSDGVEDYLLDTAQMECAEKMQFCAVNACQISLFVSHEGRHVEGNFLSAAPRIDGDRLLIPCPDNPDFSTVTFTDGRFNQAYCQ